MRWRALAHRLAARAGYRPTTIVDCGANQGQFAGMVTAIYPDTTLHVIEPQDCYWAELDAFARRRGRTHVHRLAVTEPGVARVQMHRGESGGSTGAFVTVAADGFPASLEARAATLDELFADRLSRADRALLKLDIEGHEREALFGARRLLDAVEVVYTEVRFFDIEHSGRPLFGDIAALLADCDFQLYDFGMLAARPRDQRLRIGDAVFVRRDSALAADVGWA